jgi:hypothetical protein
MQTRFTFMHVFLISIHTHIIHALLLFMLLIESYSCNIWKEREKKKNIMSCEIDFHVILKCLGFFECNNNNNNNNILEVEYKYLK